MGIPVEKYESEEELLPEYDNRKHDEDDGHAEARSDHLKTEFAGRVAGINVGWNSW